MGMKLSQDYLRKARVKRKAQSNLNGTTQDRGFVRSVAGFMAEKGRQVLGAVAKATRGLPAEEVDELTKRVDEATRVQDFMRSDGYALVEEYFNDRKKLVVGKLQSMEALTESDMNRLRQSLTEIKKFFDYLESTVTRGREAQDVLTENNRKRIKGDVNGEH